MCHLLPVRLLQNQVRLSPCKYVDFKKKIPFNVYVYLNVNVNIYWHIVEHS